MPLALVARFGPAPEGAPGADAVEAAFADTRYYPLDDVHGPVLLDRDGAHHFALYRVAAELWRDAVRHGHGHLLVGLCRGVSVNLEGGARPCGGLASAEEAADEIHYQPRGYEILFAVARARRPAELSAEEFPEDTLDLALDYRGRAPGDLSLRPAVFDVGAHSGSGPLPPPPAPAPAPTPAPAPKKDAPG